MLSDWRIDETIETGGCTSFENAKFGGEAAPEKHFFQPDELATLPSNITGFPKIPPQRRRSKRWS